MAMTWSASVVADMPKAAELKYWNDTFKDTASMKLLASSIEKHVPETIRQGQRIKNTNLFRLVRTLVLKLPSNSRADGSENSSLWMLSCPPKGHADYNKFFDANANNNTQVYLAAEYNNLVWKTLTFLTRECEVLQSAFAAVNGDGARCLMIMADKLGLGQDDVMAQAKQVLASKTLGKVDEVYSDVSDQVSDHMQLKAAAFTAYNDACRQVNAFGQQPKLKKVLDLTDFMTETAFPTTNGFPMLVEKMINEIREGNITTMQQITDSFVQEAEVMKRQCSNAGVKSILGEAHDTINAIDTTGAGDAAGTGSGGGRAAGSGASNKQLKPCTNKLSFSAGYDGKINWSKSSTCGGNHHVWSTDCPGFDPAKGAAFQKRRQEKDATEDAGRKKTKSSGDCYKWIQKGDCFKGDDCHFVHDPAKKASKSKPSKDKVHKKSAERRDKRRNKQHSEQLNAIVAEMSSVHKELAALKTVGTCPICQSPSQKHAAADCPFRSG
jgi:hypothetical protein